MLYLLVLIVFYLTTVRSGTLLDISHTANDIDLVILDVQDDYEK